MKKLFWILVLFVLAVAAFADGEIFNVTPSAMFSWYPSSAYGKFSSASDIEPSTKTTTGLNNYGISALMGLKLFDKVGAQLNMKIDDSNFQNLVDIAGRINAYMFLLKFDYHSFTGIVTWDGDKAYNPIPGGEMEFSSKWYSFSLLFRVDEWLEMEWLGLIGIGAFYGSAEIPVQYRRNKESEKLLSTHNPGFGWIKSNQIWGFSFLWDGLTAYMEAEDPSYQAFSISDSSALWIYMDLLMGFADTELDEAAVKEMAVANGFGKNELSNKNDGAGNSGYMKNSIILGLMKRWDVGKKTRIGLAVGVEMLMEALSFKNDDIVADIFGFSAGPVVRFSARF